MDGQECYEAVKATISCLMCALRLSSSLLDAQATFQCLLNTYGFLTPDLWEKTKFEKGPYQEFTDFLSKAHKISTNLPVKAE